MTIKNIIINTKCPYARNAKLAKPIRINSLNIYDEIHILRESIAFFFHNIFISKLDALCFIFTDPEFGNTIENLTRNTKIFLKSLEKEFDSFNIPIEITDYNKKSWLEIEGERFFLISFASCYDASSTRYNYNDLSTYFFLQPVRSFERHAKDNDSITDEVRRKIRILFAKNKQPYDEKISNYKNELVKIVAPLKLGDDLVMWWKS